MMDEIDFLLCLDVEECAAISRREKRASLISQKAALSVPKTRSKTRAREADSTSDSDALLMPPPRKKSKTIPEPAGSSKDIDLPASLADESSPAEQSYQNNNDIDPDTETSQDAARTTPPEISPLLLPPPLTDDHSPLASLRDTSLEDLSRLGTFFSSRHSSSDFEIYEDEATYGSQLDPNWFPTASDDKENASDGVFDDGDSNTDMEDAEAGVEAVRAAPHERIAMRERVLDEHVLGIQFMRAEQESNNGDEGLVYMALRSGARIASYRRRGLNN